MSLSEAQRLVGAFLEMIVETRDPALVWPEMLLHTQELIGFDAGYIAATWGSVSDGRGAVAEYDPQLLRQHLGRYLAEIREDEVALYTDRARVHHDVWSPARQQELAVFRELLLPSGMRHMLVRSSSRRGNVAGFNLERRSDRPFTERELRLVDLVAPLLHVFEILTACTSGDTLSPELARTYHLTERELQVVELTVRGLQNAEIALVLKVSSHTVRNTLARVFEKVGVANRAELTYAAVRTGEPERASAHLLSSDELRAFRACAEQGPAADEHATDSARPRSRIAYTCPG